jgi:hypothetical protein
MPLNRREKLQIARLAWQRRNIRRNSWWFTKILSMTQLPRKTLADDDEATAAAKAKSSNAALDSEDSDEASRKSSRWAKKSKSSRRAKKSASKSGNDTVDPQDYEDSDKDLTKSSRRAKLSRSSKSALDSDESDDNPTTSSSAATNPRSGKDALDFESSDVDESSTEVSDNAITPVKEIPAIAKVKRGHKQKAFSPTSILTPTRLLITSFDYVF